MFKKFTAVLLILLVSQGVTMNSQNKSKEKTKQSHTFIVLHTSGNVRNAQTIFIGEIDTTGPVEAIEKFLPDYSKNWVVHTDSKTEFYARVESPSSFVTDIVNNYSAQKGHLLRNNKKELFFLVEFISQENFFSEKIVHKSEKIWGTNAEAVLKKQLKGKYQKWPLSLYNQFYAEAIRPISPENITKEFIRVSVIYELD